MSREEKILNEKNGKDSITAEKSKGRSDEFGLNVQNRPGKRRAEEIEQVKQMRPGEIRSKKERPDIK